MEKTKLVYQITFPAIMILIMIATISRYGAIQDFKKRSSEHQFFVESDDIDSVEKALRGVTYQDVKKERISGDRYKIIVKCPPDNVGIIMSLISKMENKRYD